MTDEDEKLDELEEVKRHGRFVTEQHYVIIAKADHLARRVVV